MRGMYILSENINSNCYSYLLFAFAKAKAEAILKLTYIASLTLVRTDKGNE